MLVFEYKVAPHVGAWIETHLSLQRTVKDGVAPHVGAWIETYEDGEVSRSHVVAPHVGAWIETAKLILCFILLTSPLTWGRGLKHHINTVCKCA